MKNMSNHIKMTIISDFSSLSKIASEWNDLLSDLPQAMVFQTYLWNSEVGNAFSRESEMNIFCFRNKGGLVGVIPLRKVSRNIIGYKYNILNFFTHNRADCQDVILNDDISECLTLFFNYLDSKKFSWDMVYLRNIPKQSSTTDELVNYFKQNKILFNTGDGVTCPIIPINEDYDKYKKSLKSKMLGNVRRCEKRLREKGELSIVKYSGEISLESITNSFIELHIKRWAETGTPSKFCKKEHRDYYLSLFKRLYEKQFLDLCYLKLNNNIIACHFGTKYKGDVLSHTPCFDPAFSKFAPSKILLFHMLKDCFKCGYTSFNFLAGASEYKADWTQVENKTINIYVFRNKLTRFIFDIFFNPDCYRILSKFKKNI